MIVVDAAAILEVLLSTPHGREVERQLFAPDQTLHSPHLIDIEVAQVLRRYVARGQIEEVRGRAALADFLALPLHRYPHEFLLPRVWELRANMTAYDAVYVALAEVLEARLLTSDNRLAAAVRQHTRIELI